MVVDLKIRSREKVVPVEASLQTVSGTVGEDTLAERVAGSMGMRETATKAVRQEWETQK